MNKNTENTYEDMINLLSKTFGITLMQKRAEYGYTRIVASHKMWHHWKTILQSGEWYIYTWNLNINESVNYI